jgi:hypothetical protein
MSAADPWSLRDETSTYRCDLAFFAALEWASCPAFHDSHPAPRIGMHDFAGSPIMRGFPSIKTSRCMSS